MNTWSTCPSAHRGLLLARLANKIEALPPTEHGKDSARRVILNTEYLARDFVMDVNLSGYLMSGTSYAPWFHIGQAYSTIKTKFPDILQMMGEPSPSAQREELLATLRSYLEQDVPERTPSFLRRPGLTSLEKAAALFAQADYLRITKAWGIPGHGGALGPAREEMHRLLNRGQRFLQQAYKHAKASAPSSWTDLYGLLMMVAQVEVPLFEILDRLDRQVVEPIHMKDSVTHPDTAFFVHLLPTRNVESNHVRSVLELHCDMVFKGMVGKRPLKVVEVGTHLGGCILYALTHSRAQSRGVAIDAYGPATAALRRTAESNGLADRLTVLQHFICSDSRKFASVVEPTGWLSQPGWHELAQDHAPEAKSEVVACTSLESVLREQGMEEVDLLRVSVLGREYTALRSAEGLLAAGKVKSIAASVLKNTENVLEMGKMLHRHGYKLSFIGYEDEDVLRILADVDLIPAGTLTLVAQYAG
ncbi:unnamed protein product [Symbiodinium natans]|uniref:Uncharacterized protein n=1 Tax=Symbiodinium natans TaxID=878477 RepID=A0A812NRX0_9DINO|nr:unnamed protein product [Symbiodinium natans]